MLMSGWPGPAQIAETCCLGSGWLRLAWPGLGPVWAGPWPASGFWELYVDSYWTIARKEKISLI